MADKTYALDFTIQDPKTGTNSVKTVTFTAPQGPKGEKGDKGEIGPVGPQGEMGETGETGPQGERGPVGPMGPGGPQGPQGETGPQGPQGEQGPQGSSIWSGRLVKAVNESENVVITIPEGLPFEEWPKIGQYVVIAQDDAGGGRLGNVYAITAAPNVEGTKVYSQVDPFSPLGNIRGAQGSQGPQGVQGPQGEKGDKGEKGDTGPAGPQGPAGDGILWCEFDNDPFTEDVGTVALTSEQFSSLSACEGIRTTSVSGTRRVKVEWYAVGENIASGSGVVTNARTFVSAPDRGTGGMVALTINLRNNSQTSANYTKAQVSGGASSTGGTFDLGTITPGAGNEFDLTRDATDGEIQQIKDASIFKANVRGLNFFGSKAFGGAHGGDYEYSCAFSATFMSDPINDPSDMSVFGIVQTSVSTKKVHIYGAISSIVAMAAAAVQPSLDKKLDKPTTPSASSAVYIDSAGGVGTVPMTESADSGTLARRTSDGRLKANDPVDSQDLVTKQYAEANFAKGPTFLDLSGEADYQLHQGNLPGYNWAWTSLDIFTTVDSFKPVFVYGTQTFEAGKTYLALFGRGSEYTEGISASVFTVGSDGHSITWDSSKRWDIPRGSEVKMPNGAIYKIINKPTPGASPIYDYVNPIVGKIPLEPDSSWGTVWSFRNLKHCDIRVKTNSGDISAYIENCDDGSILFDCSEHPYTGGTEKLTFWFEGSNITLDNLPAYREAGNNYPQLETRCFFDYTDGAQTGVLNTRILFDEIRYYTKGFEGVTETPYLSIITPIQEGVTVYEKGVVMSVRLSFSNGHTTFARIPTFKDTSASSATAMTAPSRMAKAASVSAKPEMNYEAFSKAVAGKEGIFTVKDGRAYNLLTGKYVSE